MNEDNVMAFIYTGLVAIGAAGIVVGYWSMMRKPLKEAVEIAGIHDREDFLRAIGRFLDAKLSGDPIYNTYSPENDLELYEFYRKWSKRYDFNPWILVGAVITAQLGGGMLVLFHFRSDFNLSMLIFLFSCTAMVVLVLSLTLWRIKKKNEILAVIDGRFQEMIASQRAALADADRKEQERQAYRLSAIFAAPPLVTNEEIAANPRCMGEASFVLRGGVAFLAGLGFFMGMVFFGLAVSESAFPIFLITGLIGIPVIWVCLLIFWEKRRQKRYGRNGQGDKALGSQLIRDSRSYCSPSPIMQLPEPLDPLPRHHGDICPGCGEIRAPNAEVCPHCGQALPANPISN